MDALHGNGTYTYDLIARYNMYGRMEEWYNSMVIATLLLSANGV